MIRYLRKATQSSNVLEINIPVSICKELNLKGHDAIDVVTKGNQIIMTKQANEQVNEETIKTQNI